MTTFTASTPRYLLQEINALSADGLGIHSVVDVEASASGEVLRAETVVQPGGGERVELFEQELGCGCSVCGHGPI